MIFNICPACNAHAMELNQHCMKCDRSWHTANEDGDIDEYAEEMNQLRTQLQAANERIERLKPTIAAAYLEINKYYRNVKQESRVQSIHEDEHDLWYARDILSEALTELGKETP